jgi:hypothetical protein
VNLSGLLLVLAGYLPGALLVLAAYNVGLVHAHRSATRWNRLRGILS